MSGFYVIAGMRGYLANYHSHELPEHELAPFTLEEAREHAVELVTNWMDDSWDAFQERAGAWHEGEVAIEHLRIADGPTTVDLPRELGNEIIEIVPAEPADAAA